MGAHPDLKPRLPRNGEIRRWTPDDHDRLRAFQRANFGESARQADDGWFDWLYRANPFQGDGGPHLWVFRHQDAVTGQQGGIPFRLKAGDRDIDASWAIDLMVAPAWRLRGVGPALSEAHARSSAAAISLGMSEAALRSYRTAGWLDLGTVPTFLRVLDVPRCARLGRGGSRLAMMASRCAAPLLALGDSLHPALARLGGTRLAPIPAFDERADGLWRAASASYPVLSRRDHAALSWWFDTGPSAARYQRFLLTWNGTVKGWIVLRTDEWMGERLAVVIDYLAAPRWLPVLFSHAIDRARGQGAIALACRTLNHRARGAFRALGFLTLENGYRTPTRMMLRLNGEAEGLAGLLGDPRNWLVTAGNSDTGLRDLTP